MTARTVSEVLSAAADLVDKPGAWTQGAYGKRFDDGGYQCLCMFGAICEAIRSTRGHSSIWPYIHRAVFKIVGDNFIAWNDAPGRTQAEVVTALRTASTLAKGGE